MRRLTTLLAVLLMVVTELLATFGAAAAEPAQRYTEDFCTESQEADGLHTLCFQTTGTTTFNETPSGVFRSHDSGQTCFQHYVDDTLVEQGCRRYNFVNVAQGSQTQVDHWNIRFTKTEGGVTCTGAFLFQYANNETKRDFSLECL
jgi:hypothetical protein